MILVRVLNFSLPDRAPLSPPLMMFKQNENQGWLKKALTALQDKMFESAWLLFIEMRMHLPVAKRSYHITGDYFFGDIYCFHLKIGKTNFDHVLSFRSANVGIWANTRTLPWDISILFFFYKMLRARGVVGAYNIDRAETKKGHRHPKRDWRLRFLPTQYHSSSGRSVGNIITTCDV